MLTTYPEIRDRIYERCRGVRLRPDWIEETRVGRVLHLVGGDQVVVARTFVPTKLITLAKLARLEHDLAGVLGEGWLQ